MMLHMHRLGQAGSLTLVKADGTEQPLLDIPRWDFDWQFSYELSEPVDFQDGDKLRLECIFDNSIEGFGAVLRVHGGVEENIWGNELHFSRHQRRVLLVLGLRRLGRLGGRRRRGGLLLGRLERLLPMLGSWRRSVGAG